MKAREVQPNGDLAGVRVNLDGDGDLNKICLDVPGWAGPDLRRPVAQARRRGAAKARFNDYTMEVVQQVGSDSFAPGHGVLIGKSKTLELDLRLLQLLRLVHRLTTRRTSTRSTSCAPTARRSRPLSGDERQLNDVYVNVGRQLGRRVRIRRREPTSCTSTSSTSAREADGILRYKVGVRSTAGAGPQTRGVSVGAGACRARPRAITTCTFPLRNTGAAAATDPTLHPQDANAYLNSDIYRLSASAAGSGWTAHLRTCSPR